MISINSTPARDYCRQGTNILDAAVTFEVDGDFYTEPPTFALAGGAGVGDGNFDGHAVVTNGRVTSLIIDAPGATYTDGTFALVFSGGGGGSGVTGTATILGGIVTALTLTNGGGKTILFTDMTDYGAGEARQIVQISLFDKYGVKLETSIAAGGGGTVTTSLGALNTNDGIDGIVTVISDQGNVKDGSVYDMVTLKQIGNFLIES